MDSSEEIRVGTLVSAKSAAKGWCEARVDKIHERVDLTVRFQESPFSKETLRVEFNPDYKSGMFKKFTIRKREILCRISTIENQRTEYGIQFPDEYRWLSRRDFIIRSDDTTNKKRKNVATERSLRAEKRNKKK
ncbi:Protein CBG28104 [Caenorhabditis briggsae]|uniref:Protein CBG28104 n=1 Tax=Caenorhabditis briggsae TaxID=6238 RepID=B6IGU3_CAEBR|nr:Protein CBG28104 [Caenorhabditis briggsae]CAR99123.1 Protein CBG28104 [Caenorhabditis briggsae]